MSDNWIRIVPINPDFVPSGDRSQALVDEIKRLMPRALEVTVEAHDHPMFVDAGSNNALDSAACPECEAAVPGDWLPEEISRSWDSSRFEHRLVRMACCGAEVDLNDHGEFPVAFARWWIDCMNPMVGRLGNGDVNLLAETLGHPVTIVYRHL